MIQRTQTDSYEWYASPDHSKFQFDGGKLIDARWEDDNAIPFVVCTNNECFIGNKGEGHYEMCERINLTNYEAIDIKGRIWTEFKIMVTWENISSNDAKIIANAFKAKINLNILNYAFVCDSTFFDDGDDVVYEMPLKDFITSNIKASDIPSLYQRQEKIKGQNGSQKNAEFAYNGVSGNLGKYLSTVWGDSIEHANNTTIEEKITKYDSDNVYASPDFVKVNGIHLKYTTPGAHAFVITRNGIVAFSEECDTHDDLFEYDEDLMYSNRSISVAEGRLWTEQKIVAVWGDLTSQQARLLRDIYKNFFEQPMKGYTIVYEEYIEDGDDKITAVYTMPFDEFISSNVSLSEIPRLYQKQGKISRSTQKNAEFAYNGVSGNLGKYLSTTWGDSIEHDENGKTVILHENQMKKFLSENETKKSIAITLPSNIDWNDYQKELNKVADGSEIMNFKVPFLPKESERKNIDKCYLVYKGNVVGWMSVCGFSEGNKFDCTTTGKQWEGKFIQRTGKFHPLENPIPMKGFQGWRYFKES